MTTSTTNEQGANVVQKIPHHLRKEIAFTFAAFFFALGVNIALFAPEVTQYMQASTIDAQISGNSGHVITDTNKEDTFIIRSNTNLQGVHQLSFSLLYNAASVQIHDIISRDPNAKIVFIPASRGVVLVQVTFNEPRNFVQGDAFIEAKYSLVDSVKNKTILLADSYFQTLDGTRFDLTTTSLDM